MTYLEGFLQNLTLSISKMFFLKLQQHHRRLDALHFNVAAPISVFRQKISGKREGWQKTQLEQWNSFHLFVAFLLTFSCRLFYDCCCCCWWWWTNAMSVNKSRGAKFIQKSYQGNSFFSGQWNCLKRKKACSFQKLNLIVKMTRSTKPIAQAKTTYASARKLNAFSFLSLSLSLSLKPAPTLSLSLTV